MQAAPGTLLIHQHRSALCSLPQNGPSAAPLANCDSYSSSIEHPAAMASTSFKSASLVVMLMLAALVASAQATDNRSVWVKNTLPTIAKCNGVEIPPGGLKQIDLELSVKLVVAVLGKDGKWGQGECDVPRDVAKVAVQLDVNGRVVVEVAVLGGLIHQLLNTLLGTILIVIIVLL